MKKLSVLFLTLSCATAQAATFSPELVARITAEIAKQLRDPYSAVIEGLYYVETTNIYPGIYLCGTVNGKNAYGGYAGRTRFYYDEVRRPDGVVFVSGVIEDRKDSINRILMEPCDHPKKATQ
jgi:hypothetical protein